MASLIKGVWRQGVGGQALVISLSIIFGLGLFVVAVGYVCLVWALVLTHGFGIPALDVWSGVGVVLALLPFVAFAVLTRGRE